MANNTGTLVGATVRPFSTADTFAVAHQDEIKGGLHTVSTINSPAFNAELPDERRQVGMWIYALDDGKTYVMDSNLSSLTEKVFGDTITIATQAEAEAGTDNTKVMTALKVKQAIDSNFTKLPIRIALFQNGVGAYPQVFKYPQQVVVASITLADNCSNYSITIGGTTYHKDNSIVGVTINANVAVLLNSLTISSGFAANALLILNPA